MANTNELLSESWGRIVWGLTRWLIAGATIDQVYDYISIYRPGLQSALDWLCERDRRVPDLDHYGWMKGRMERVGLLYRPVREDPNPWVLEATWPTRFVELGKATVLVREERGRFGMQPIGKRPGRERWFDRDIDRAVAIRDYMLKVRRKQWHQEQRGEGTPIGLATDEELTATFGVAIDDGGRG